MTDTPRTHAASDQTTPAIYVGHGEFSPGAADDGSFQQWMINLTLDGECTWKTRAGTYSLVGGAVVMTRPGTVMHWRVPRVHRQDDSGQAAHSNGYWETAYAVFHPRPHWHDWLDGFDFREGWFYTPTAGEERRRVNEAMGALVETYQAGGRLRDEYALLALEKVLLLLFERSEPARAPRDARLSRAIDFIHANLALAIDVNRVAAATNLSPSHLSSLFAQQTGLAPAQYIERTRLARAAELLGFSAVSIHDIAELTGYSEANYLARRFKLRYGMTPTAYRNASRHPSTR